MLASTVHGFLLTLSSLIPPLRRRHGLRTDVPLRSGISVYRDVGVLRDDCQRESQADVYAVNEFSTLPDASLPGCVGKRHDTRSLPGVSTSAMMGGEATHPTHQPWQRNWSLSFGRGYDRSDVAVVHRLSGRKQRLVCFVMVDSDNGRIIHLIAEEGVNWSNRILDRFFWITENVGDTRLLSRDSDEGFCRCVFRKGTGCGSDCEMVKVGAECAGSAHGERDCGNKRAGSLLKSGNWPKVELDVFPGMGLGVRAGVDIAEKAIVGAYLGRVKPLPKRRTKG
eukprot:1800725-Rhodomonas_salina.1